MTYTQTFEVCRFSDLKTIKAIVKCLIFLIRRIFIKCKVVSLMEEDKVYFETLGIYKDIFKI